MAKRKPLVFVAGEIVESKISDTIDGNNISVTTAGTPTERLLKDRFADIINVKDYGAKGNGIADDTAAFQAAALAAEDKHGVVYVPAGIYKIADDINGEFITFGHVGFVGEGTLTHLTDLYDDYVHKTGNINETVTGDKNFTGTTTIELGNIHTKQFSGTTVNSSDGNCNLANGNVFEINASTANKTITFTNVPAGNSIIGLIINKGENKTISWPENIQWAFGSEPELLVGYNYIYLMTPNGGTNWYGFSVTQPIDPNEILANIKLKNKGGLAKDSNGIYINTKNNGGLGIDNNNQVYVDFSKITASDILDEVNEILAQLSFDGLDEAAVKAIVTSMLLNAGGLAVDNNGKLYVKLKNPGGLAKDANGLYINLASGGGLEFNSNNQLKVKISDLDLGTGSSIDLTTLVDGTTIKVVNNKLTISAPGTATLLADGTTILANNGKLNVNPDTVVDTVHGMIKTGGGILIESGTGKLYLDLSNLEIDPSILNFDLSNYVTLDAAQTITGVKTFTNGLIGDLDGTADQALADGEGNNIIATYAPLASPELTGTPTAPTPTTGDNSTKLATTAFVQTAIENSGNSLFTANINNLFFSYINSASITYGLVYSVSEGASSNIYGFKFPTNLLNNIKQQPFPLFILDLLIGMQNSTYTRTFTEFSVRENNLIQSLPLYIYDATNRDWVRYTNVSHKVSSSYTGETIYGWAYYDFNGTINSHAPSSILFVQNTPLFINYALSTILSPNTSIGGLVDTEHIQVPIIQTDSFGKIDSINGTTVRAEKNNATNAVYFRTEN